MRVVQRPRATLVAAALLLAAPCAANFAATTSFDMVVKGGSLVLSWEAFDPKSYPLYITAQLLDRGADGSSATGYKANITTGLTGNSFTWDNVPYPLNWQPDGLYSLEVKPGDGSNQALLKSPHFAVQTQVMIIPDDDSGPPSMSRTLGIILGVAIGLPMAIVLSTIVFCCKKRQFNAARERRARLLEEKRRQKRKEFIIN